MSIYSKLPSTQIKNLTSSDVMKLGQLTYADTKSIDQLNQLNKITKHSQNLVAPGASVFADSLKMGSQTANAGAVSWKPSNIYDSETYASTYLVQVLAIGASASGGDSASVAIGLTDGSSTLTLQKATTVTASGPLTFEPSSPLFINELNYLQVSNSASVDSVITVYCALVARGGAQ